MPDQPTQPLTQTYRQVSLTGLSAASDVRVDGRPAIERLPYRDEAVLDLPPFIRGDTDIAWHSRTLPRPDGFASGRFTGPPIAAYLIRNALIHGQYGIITFADRVVAASLYHVPFHIIPGAARLADGRVTLPDWPLSATVPHAYHLLAGNLDNYFHWLIDALSRFRPDLFGDAPALTGAATPPVLLVPECSTDWQRQALALAVPPTVPRVALSATGRVLVERLLYLPDLSAGAWNPHPAMLHLFDRLRDEHAGIPPPSWQPWRRIYVSRADSQNRRLLNEAEVAACAQRAGFEIVTLSGMPVADQIRLFANASHIISPHGAGLTNIGFCHPGAALCELHMDSYPHWAFRRLAALRGVRYDCVIGTALEPRHDWVHRDTWTLDVADLDRVLADPRFIRDV